MAVHKPVSKLSLNRRELEAPGLHKFTVRCTQALETAAKRFQINMSEVARIAITMEIRRRARAQPATEAVNERTKQPGGGSISA